MYILDIQYKMATLEENKTSKQSVSIVLIETNGTIKTLKTKEVTEESLYKKCGFRISDDFIKRHTWRVTLKEKEVYTVCVWAKKTGKANFENKYDFPPPIDNELFFGTCAIVRMAETNDDTTSQSAGNFLDLTKETWLKIYEKLFGGFEDIGDEDEFSEDELENVDPALLTSHGYLKDDFVVSDKESIELESDESDTSLSSATITNPSITKEKIKEKAAVKKQTKPPTKAKTKTDTTKSDAPLKKIVKRKGGQQSKKQADNSDDEHSDTDKEETDTSELEEEVYTFSDDD